MVKTNIQKHIIENISFIHSKIIDIKWVQNKIQEIYSFKPNIRYSETMSLETKIILQQSKIYIIESFWQYFLNKYKITSKNLLFYIKNDKINIIDILNFKDLKKIELLLEKYPINYFQNDDTNKYDQILCIANYYWLDLIRKEIVLFEHMYINQNKSNNQLYWMQKLYTNLESYYLPKEQRESWIGNLEQEFAPLFKIYLRGVNYKSNLITRESIEEFIATLYKCIRKEAVSNNNNFIFSDTDFNDFTSNCPIHIKKESIANIKLQQVNKRYDSTVLGCPAVFSKVKTKYKFGQLLKDIFYWQMDLYKEILLIID